MSDQDPTVITDEPIEAEVETEKPSRIKTALKKVAPYSAYITTAVVVLVGGALIYKAVDAAEDDEVIDPITDPNSEVLIVED